MLSQDLLKQIRNLQIRTSHLVTDVMAGEYQSSFKGRGMEFEEARVYTPGDDVRNIDWNITARTGIPHVKSFREERELTVNLLIDISASGFYGTRKRTKNEVSAELAAVLAHVTMSKNDKIGAILFSDQVEHFIPPKKGRPHVWNLIKSILTFKPQHEGTNIGMALDFMNRVLKRRSVVFLISDFIDHSYERALSITSRRHDLIAVSITDPSEFDLPKLGSLRLKDNETGKTMVLNTKSKDVRNLYRANQAQAKENMLLLFRQLKIDHLQLSTEKEIVEPLVQLFQKRLRKIKG